MLRPHGPPRGRMKCRTECRVLDFWGCKPGGCDNESWGRGVLRRGVSGRRRIEWSSPEVCKVGNANKRRACMLLQGLIRLPAWRYCSHGSSEACVRACVRCVHAHARGGRGPHRWRGEGRRRGARADGQREVRVDTTRPRLVSLIQAGAARGLGAALALRLAGTHVRTVNGGKHNRGPAARSQSWGKKGRAPVGAEGGGSSTAAQLAARAAKARRFGSGFRPHHVNRWAQGCLLKCPGTHVQFELNFGST